MAISMTSVTSFDREYWSYPCATGACGNGFSISENRPCPCPDICVCPCHTPKPNPLKAAEKVLEKIYTFNPWRFQ